jgi:hypothetical protein
MPAPRRETPRRRLVAAKLTDEEHALLHRACRRLGITRIRACALPRSFSSCLRLRVVVAVMFPFP